MGTLGHAAIRFRHLGYLREHVAFTVPITRASAPPLVQDILHRGSFLGRQQLGRPAAADRGLRCLLWAHACLLKVGLFEPSCYCGDAPAPVAPWGTPSPAGSDHECAKFGHSTVLGYPPMRTLVGRAAWWPVDSVTRTRPSTSKVAPSALLGG